MPPARDQICKQMSSYGQISHSNHNSHDKVHKQINLKTYSFWLMVSEVQAMVSWLCFSGPMWGRRPWQQEHVTACSSHGSWEGERDRKGSGQGRSLQSYNITETRLLPVSTSSLPLPPNQIMNPSVASSLDKIRPLMIQLLPESPSTGHKACNTWGFLRCFRFEL